MGATWNGRPRLVAVMFLGSSLMTQAGRVALSVTTRYQFMALRGDSPGQIVPSQIMMAIRPFGGVGNLSG